MADENTLRLKLTIFQAKTLYKIISAFNCSEVEDYVLVSRLKKSIEEFLLLKGNLTREQIAVEVKDEMPDFDAIDKQLAEFAKTLPNEGKE